MRFFALDTDIVERVRLRYCSESEKEIFLTHFHWMSFFFRTMREFLITMALGILVALAFAFDWPMLQGFLIAGSAWVVFVFFRILKALIDWRYDFLLLTSERMLIIDQTSFFQQKQQQIHLENIGGVSTSTQFLDIFPFGEITLHLKEGLGGDVVNILYVPEAERKASVIADTVAKYQRMRHPERALGGQISAQGAEKS